MATAVQHVATAAEASFGAAAQRAWAATSIRQRLAILRALRHRLAESTSELIDAISPTLARNRADTLAAEILPLLEACRFLERNAQTILAPRRLGRRGLPFWLAGVDATVERVPLGIVLVIAPSNYPLFLPGVQALQALAAGNAVVWKPGRNGEPIAHAFARLCAASGLPDGLLRVTDESIEVVAREIAAQPAMIVFTGSAAAGRAVQRLAAERSIPVVAELSGCDAVVALPSADPERLADALCFGMRLNGSATCMAPRRLILVGTGHRALLAELQRRFAAMDPVFVSAPTRAHLETLLADAASHGATPLATVGEFSMRPILVLDGSPVMQLAESDLFAPVLTVFSASDTNEAISLVNANPFGLTASIFGDEREARALAAQLEVGTVLINDLIVPTADPRVPFGGRKASGFGATRGAEGLLEMTAPKVVSARRNNYRKHLQPTGPAHEELFTGVAIMIHAKQWKTRLSGLKRTIAAAKKL
jgi:aldehyde dehydrogenase (NAD+)